MQIPEKTESEKHEREQQIQRESLVNSIFVVMEEKVYDQDELSLYSTYCFKRDCINKNGMINQATTLISKWYDQTQVFVIANNLMIYLIPEEKVYD